MKKIKDWFIGLCVAMLGGMICIVCVATIKYFIDMIHTTGSDCIGNFLRFILGLLGVILMPYVFFKILEDGLHDKRK